jgi:exodeoxyribonuclease III
MRFATLNVSGPSAGRAGRLLEFLPSLEADVLVLTETRQNPGTAQLLGSYRDSGYAVVAAQSMDASERGVAVIQRAGRPVPLTREVTAEARHRLVASELCADLAVTVVGAYVPSRDASPAKIARKQRFLAQMTTLAGRWAHQRLVFLGDLNIVSRQHVYGTRQSDADALSRNILRRRLGRCRARDNAECPTCRPRRCRHRPTSSGQ